MTVREICLEEREASEREVDWWLSVIYRYNSVKQRIDQFLTRWHSCNQSRHRSNIIMTIVADRSFMKCSTDNVLTDKELWTVWHCRWDAKSFSSKNKDDWRVFVEDDFELFLCLSCYRKYVVLYEAMNTVDINDLHTESRRYLCDGVQVDVVPPVIRLVEFRCRRENPYSDVDLKADTITSWPFETTQSIWDVVYNDYGPFSLSWPTRSISLTDDIDLYHFRIRAMMSTFAMEELKMSISESTSPMDVIWNSFVCVTRTQRETPSTMNTCFTRTQLSVTLTSINDVFFPAQQEDRQSQRSRKWVRILDGFKSKTMTYSAPHYWIIELRVV